MATSAVVGMWKLVSLERTSADNVVTQASDPVGFLIYTPEGWLSEAFEYRNADGSTSHVIYCGTYEVEGETVTHIPSVHTNPELVGARLDRTFAIDGDHFTLTAHSSGGTAVLIWERVR
jgi:hypothetical protein